MTRSRFAVLGSGDVGRTLAQGLKNAGLEVRIGSRTAGKLDDFTRATGVANGTFAEVAAGAGTIVLAVKGLVAADALHAAGAANLDGKVVIDTTNPIAAEPPEDGVLRFFTGPNDSLMERLQSAFPRARFVKAFNCIGHAYMVKPSLPGGPPTMFICGNDAAARDEVTELLRQFGHDVADMGSAKSARAIEPLCQLWCIPGLRGGSWQHAFRLLRQ